MYIYIYTPVLLSSQTKNFSELDPFNENKIEDSNLPSFCQYAFQTWNASHWMPWTHWDQLDGKKRQTFQILRYAMVKMFILDAKQTFKIFLDKYG